MRTISVSRGGQEQQWSGEDRMTHKSAFKLLLIFAFLLSLTSCKNNTAKDGTHWTDEQLQNLVQQHYEHNAETLQALAVAFTQSGESQFHLHLTMGEFNDKAFVIPEALQQAVTDYILNSGLPEDDYIEIDFYNPNIQADDPEHMPPTYETFWSDAQNTVGQISIMKSNDYAEFGFLYLNYYEDAAGQSNILDNHWAIWYDILYMDGI